MFGFKSQFALYSSAGKSFAQTGTAQTTVDASNTGSITIQVLTPNAGFTSDSGATYAGVAGHTGVPEPSSALPFLGAGGDSGGLANAPAGTSSYESERAPAITHARLFEFA